MTRIIKWEMEIIEEFLRRLNDRHRKFCIKNEEFGYNVLIECFFCIITDRRPETGGITVRKSYELGGVAEYS